jgi:hypothetical protein
MNTERSGSASPDDRDDGIDWYVQPRPATERLVAFLPGRRRPLTPRPRRERMPREKSYEFG